jgi:hypothetical protein
VTDTIDYGIDLGTTNSCIARWEGGSVRVFQNNDQMNVTPSAVHILKNGRVIVGRRGYAAKLTDPDNVSTEFKRWMGQKDRKHFPLTQRELSAEELSAEVLKSLKEDVRRQTGTNVTAAVITVPAAFGALQCEATARAAQLAGLEEAPLLQEPIAATIGYGIGLDITDQRWLVFDLGGGTLDIAVVSTREGRLNVLEHRGNNLLGGKDIDRLIVEHVLLPALEENYELRASGPNGARSTLLPRLRIKAEEAKIDLSTEKQVIISLFDLGSKDDSGKPIDMEVPLTRSQLEALMAPRPLCCSGRRCNRARVGSGRDLLPNIRHVPFQSGSRADLQDLPGNVRKGQEVAEVCNWISETQFAKWGSIPKGLPPVLADKYVVGRDVEQAGVRRIGRRLLVFRAERRWADTLMVHVLLKGSVAADLGVCSRVELHASEPRVIWYIQQQKASRHDVPPTL